MGEHPDSLWQPYPDEVGRGHPVRTRQTRAGGPRPTVAPLARAARAMEIVEERYARGEIDTRELQERRAALQGNPG